MHKYYAQENGKIYYAITSRDARENDATQTSEVSKYQIISQPKLDTSSSCNFTANVQSDGQNSIIVAETHVYMKASSATMQRGSRQRDLWRTHVRCPSN